MNELQRKTLGPGPYILVQDDDSHWYIIPHRYRADWEAWNGSEEAQIGRPPSWAWELGGSPSNVSFPDFEVPK